MKRLDDAVPIIDVGSHLGLRIFDSESKKP